MKNAVISVVLVLLLVEYVTNSEIEEKKLSRRKRYLMFPEGSNFLITVANPKRLLTNMRPKGWNGLLECDVFFKLPSDTRKMIEKYQYPHPGPYYLHHRDRRALYRGLHEVLEMSPSGDGSDTFHHDAYMTTIDPVKCADVDKECPFSILEVLLSWPK
uniref:Uncharacterized protein n=1 Tax=Timema cristinae TaxID=61476 RepID=A0A7R9D0W2_TIMCR|nr:unnamed protein product [Timema cristinae]